MAHSKNVFTLANFTGYGRNVETVSFGGAGTDDAD
jgi:hypothetical protein